MMSSYVNHRRPHTTDLGQLSRCGPSKYTWSACPRIPGVSPGIRGDWSRFSKYTQSAPPTYTWRPRTWQATYTWTCLEGGGVASEYTWSSPKYTWRVVLPALAFFLSTRAGKRSACQVYLELLHVYLELARRRSTYTWRTGGVGLACFVRRAYEIAFSSKYTWIFAIVHGFSRLYIENRHCTWRNAPNRERVSMYTLKKLESYTPQLVHWEHPATKKGRLHRTRAGGNVEW